MNHYMLLAWDDFYPLGGVNDLVCTIEAVNHASARRISELRVRNGDPRPRDEWQLLWINPETVDVEVIGNWMVKDKFGKVEVTEGIGE